jgi:hypothetical protein
VCAAPVVAAYVAYYVWQPTSHVNYGELIEPRPMPDVPLQGLDGRTVRFSDVKGEWLLLTADKAACDDACRRKLVYMRQVRLAQGKEAERIEHMWLLTDAATPDAKLLAEHPELRVVRARADVLARLESPAGTATDHIFVVDPLGNLMMRFPPDADPRRMLRDLARLLRQSRWK